MAEQVKFKERDLKKGGEFVDHLLSTPAIKSESIIIAEELIHNFLINNRMQLVETFKNPQFFPDLEWDQVLEIIFRNIYDRILASSLPLINNFIQNSDLSFFDRISESGIVAENHRKERLHEFFLFLLKNRNSRHSMNCAVNILKFNVADRYIGEIFKRRDFLHNELVRVQKMNLDAAAYIVFIKTMLIIRSAAHLKLPVNPSDSEAKYSINDIQKNRRGVAAYADGASRALSRMLPGIPASVIKLALKSNLPAELTEDEESAARFLYILCARYQNYRQMEKIDRGAESQDKSWFAAARKNSGHFGYDKRIIEGLYLIAGDNNW